MNIDPSQVAEAPRQIGEVVRPNQPPHPAFQVRLKGGLYLIVSRLGGLVKTLGTGSHRGLARWIAEKFVEGDGGKLSYTELSKSEWVDPRQFDPQEVAAYEDLTARYRAWER